MAVNGNVAKGLGEPSSVRKNHKRCRDSLDKVNDHFIGELQKLRTGSPRTTTTSGGRRCGPQATWTATPSTTMCGEQVSDHHQVPPQHFGLPEDLHSGRVCGHVQVSLAVDGHAVRMAVQDDGEGIAQDHLHRLTERFYRVYAARSRQAGGTGLGMAIVKHIVNRHRGRLVIDSTLGQGSCFTVFWPQASQRQ